ncbi:MAG: diphthamide biosynthesis enzyme Dph2 [Thermoplasmatales archaeon]|nr:MAG: diphthamide biosynthesis enzyme Dph2 [Thermoplasmatales archaeon]
MDIPGYSIDFEKIVKTIKKEKYKRVVLQLPEGLKTYASQIVEFLENNTKATIIVSADPCFGACDITNYELKNFDVDLIIQIGHVSIPDVENLCIATLFVNAKSDINISNAVKKALPFLKEKGKKIGLVSTSQHVHTLKKVEKILIENSFQPFIGEGDSRISLKGQILGCNFSAALSIAKQVDLFLYLGSGNFHPLGLMLSTKKPVIAIDPYTIEIREKELEELKDLILRQRYGAIASSKDAKKFGILVSMKRGQQRINLAYKIKQMLDSKNKKSYIITAENFSYSILEGFRDIDCFISTACPRIAIDDYLQYKKPIITPIELEIVLDKRKWEDYRFDQIL